MIAAAIKEIGVEDGFYILSGEQYIGRLVRGICAKLAAVGEKSSLDNCVHFISHHEARGATAMYTRSSVYRCETIRHTRFPVGA